MNKFEAIKEAVEARDAFLAIHPELLPLQEEINRILKASGSIHNRQAALQQMMLNKWNEILPLFGVKR